MRSYEMFARYVMPVFQSSLDPIASSNAWARENRKQVFGRTVEAVRRAFTDHGAAVPEDANREADLQNVTRTSQAGRIMAGLDRHL